MLPYMLLLLTHLRDGAGAGIDVASGNVVLVDAGVPGVGHVVTAAKGVLDGHSAETSGGLRAGGATDVTEIALRGERVRCSWNKQKARTDSERHESANVTEHLHAQTTRGQ
eukprot:759818-Hanusia_phi.AAC.3